MDPVTGALLGSGMSVAGGYFTNQANKEIASDQMRFQERMSSTAHQRQVKDLQAAGLNPILSANSGASSPSGASIEMQNPLKDVGTNFAKAMDLKIANKNLENTTAKNNSDIQTNAAMQTKLNADAVASAANAKQTQMQTEILRQTSPYQIDKSKLDHQLLVPDAILNRAGAAMGIAKDARTLLFGGGDKKISIPSDLGSRRNYDPNTGLIYPDGMTRRTYKPYDNFNKSFDTRTMTPEQKREALRQMQQRK